ncbi:hypothetical protein MPNT_100050 [Candidatus Methylacidithermus pantelleriae]|uniref:Uncharacterized protein n=1 Tax=Candidatus Methylacidithermus pantelleriae TaxID=2744239 RepID=A0A8J2BK01_9BACT|nr:hypothetical protein MPNT_100050 [Candidatus Methylacidithermus pantelleriae]
MNVTTGLRGFGSRSKVSSGTLKALSFPLRTSNSKGNALTGQGKGTYPVYGPGVTLTGLLTASVFPSQSQRLWPTRMQERIQGER